MVGVKEPNVALEPQVADTCSKTNHYLHFLSPNNLINKRLQNNTKMHNTTQNKHANKLDFSLMQK